MSSILTLNTLDIAEGLGILVGERRVLISDAVELSLDLVELGLGGIQFVGGFLAGLSRMGAGGQAKKNSRGGGAEKSLKGSAARKLLRKGWNRCLVTYVLRYMFIYMSLNSNILTHIALVPTISTNGWKQHGQRLANTSHTKGKDYANDSSYEYVNINPLVFLPRVFWAPPAALYSPQEVFLIR